MKSSLATISILVLARLSLVSAQPVLTDDNALRRLVGLTVEFSTFDASSPEDAQHLVEATGTDRTWDVSTLTLVPSVSQSNYVAEPRPGMPNATDPRLTEANVVVVENQNSGSWTYQRLDETGQYALGRVTVEDFDRDGRVDTLVAIFDPVSKIFPFPLTMGTMWADSSTQTLEFQGSPPVPVETVVASHVVEGWGALVSLDGTSPALRIRTSARITSSSGQTSTRTTIRVITPLPEEIAESTVYPSRVEMLVDSLDNLLSLSYVSLTASRPTSNEPRDPMARTLDLEPNYPNPFRGTTTIPFLISDAGHVQISVYDIVGRRIAEILDENLPPGAHRVVWSAGEVPSGVYRVLLETKTSASSRLVVVQK